jgi:transposase
MKKKNSRVSPCLLQLKILKTVFIGDIELWSSRHLRHRYRRYRHHRRSRSNFENKEERCKRQSVGQVNKDGMVRLTYHWSSLKIIVNVIYRRRRRRVILMSLEK